MYFEAKSTGGKFQEFGQAYPDVTHIGAAVARLFQVSKKDPIDGWVPFAGLNEEIDPLRPVAVIWHEQNNLFQNLAPFRKHFSHVLPISVLSRAQQAFLRQAFL